MKKNRKRLMAVVLMLVVACMTLSAGAAGQYTKTVQALFGVSIMLNGEPFVAKTVNGTVVQPMVVDGTTYLPVRALSEALGMDVEWDAKTNTVKLSSEPQDEWTAVDNAFVSKMNANSLDKKLHTSWFDYTSDEEWLKNAGDYGYKTGFIYKNDDGRWIEKSYVTLYLDGAYQEIAFHVALDDAAGEYGTVTVFVKDLDTDTVYVQKTLQPGDNMIQANISSAARVRIEFKDSLFNLYNTSAKETRSLVIGNMKLK